MSKNIKVIIVIVLLSLVIAGGIWFIASKEWKNENTVEDQVEYDLDKIYDSKICEGYEDIRKIDKEYNKELAQKDNCLVIGAMVHNENVMIDFIEKYNNKESAFIRIAQNNKNGELYLIDLFYDSVSDKVYCVTDTTRDSSKEENKRVIELKKYEHMENWKYKDGTYWIVYNGELPSESNSEEMINQGNLYIISRIG